MEITFLMKILAIDTSSIACSVALLDDKKIRLKHEVIPLQHAKSILAFIEEVLDAEIASLDALAWGCGPGSFTGLRIAAGVIQSIGFAHQLPIISISSLAALAQTAYAKHGWKEMLVAIDARMAEVYWGTYLVNSIGYVELVGQEIRSVPGEIVGKKLINSPYHGVGDAWSSYKTVLSHSFASAPESFDVSCLPSALAVAHLARIKYEKGEWLQPWDALPKYLRDNVIT